MRLLFLFVLIVSSAFACSAQQVAVEQWYVLVHEGAVSVDGKVDIAFGSKVAAASSIVVGSHAYLAVFSSTGRVVEVGMDSTFSLKDCKAQLGLAGFSAEELIKQSGHANLDVRPATGAVCAGVPAVDFLTGSGSFMEGDTVRFSWKHMTQDSLYTFFLQDIFYDKAIWSVQTTRNEVILPFEAKRRLEESGDEQFFASLVSHAYHASTEVPIKYILSKSGEATWRREIEKTYSDKTAAECLLKALLLTGRKFSFAGDGYFRRAVTIRPSVTAFKKIHKNFRREFETDCQ